MRPAAAPVRPRPVHVGAVDRQVPRGLRSQRAVRAAVELALKS